MNLVYIWDLSTAWTWGQQWGRRYLKEPVRFCTRYISCSCLKYSEDLELEHVNGGLAGSSDSNIMLHQTDWHREILENHNNLGLYLALLVFCSEPFRFLDKSCCSGMLICPLAENTLFLGNASVRLATLAIIPCLVASPHQTCTRMQLWAPPIHHAASVLHE